MPIKKMRRFFALVRVHGYKKLFELDWMQVRGGVSFAREIVQEQFSMQVDNKRYPRIPKNHTPKRKDIKIVWGQEYDKNGRRIG